MRYRWILLDADGTLFDYNRAEAAALSATCADTGLPWADGHLEVYRRVNSELWRELELGTASPDRIKVERFERLFEAIGSRLDAEDFSRRYLARLAGCGQLIDGAAHVVARLAHDCRLAVITNGLAEVQRPRIAASPLAPHFSAIIISEEVGSAKPETDIFGAALTAMGGPPKRDVLMVGDSLTSDVAGGARFGIDTCWFNPSGAKAAGDPEPTFTISALDELLEIVGIR